MKAFKAEKRIAVCSAEAGISPQAKNWMDRALDPFKDVIQSIEGYPDMNCAPSCIQEVKKQLTIAAPGVAAWDANIFFSQTPMTINLYQTTRTNATLIQSTQSATPYKEGGVIIRKAAAGTPLDMTTTTDSVELGTNYYTNSESRVVAWAFEVTDVTSELYRQGAVTVWRSPLVTDPNDTSVYTFLYDDAGVTACTPTSAAMCVMGSVPTTSADALLLPNAEQWDAKEGCYVVAVQDGQDNPARGLTYKMLSRFESPLNYVEQLTSTGANKLIKFTNGNKVDLPFIPAGAYFTGLNPNSVLQLTVRYYVERFPSKDNLDLVVLARPSTPYDPRALEVYSKVASRLPVGTRKRDNGFGDWISSIASSISSVVSAFSPIAGGILGAASGMQTYFNNFDQTTRRSYANQSQWVDSSLEKYNNTPTAQRISPPVNPPVVQVQQQPRQITIKDDKKYLQAQNEIIQLKVENKRLKMQEKAEMKMKPVRQGPFLPNGKFKSSNNKKKLRNQKFVYIDR